MRKRCTKCRKSKEVTCFYADSQKKSGLSSACKKCKNKQSYAYFLKKKYEHYLISIKSRYGLTREQYEALLKKQNNVCAICLGEGDLRNTGEIIRLHVDHCHDTGKVRGLLCFRCNSGIGKFKDNVASLERAINYLKQ